MKYICLGYIAPGKLAGMPEDELHALLDDAFDYDDHLRANGHVVAAVPLEAPSTAVTLTWNDGEVTTTDGSFAETRQQLDGIRILEARDLNHAIQLISRHPGLRLGTTEIRPVVDLTGIRRESEQRRRRKATAP